MVTETHARTASTAERSLRGAAEDAWRHGRVIAICGIDGSGKSTLGLGLAARLVKAGHDVVHTRQPTDFYRSLAPVRSYHDEGRGSVPVECLALLSAADRALHLETEVIPALRRGAIVLSDRFLPAARAIFATRMLDGDWVDTINQFCPRAHGQVLLDISGVDAVARITSRGGYIRLEERSPEILEDIRQRYLEQRQPNALVLDAHLPPERLVDEAAAYVTSLLPASAGRVHS